MEALIKQLHGELGQIAIEYLVFQKRDNVKRIEKVMPQIQEFVLWFLDSNQFGISQELYQGLCNTLLEILNDIVEAIQQKDYVLMHDAAAYGLMEYMEMFMGNKEDSADDDI